MRRITRWLFWVVKGFLLLIAIAALMIRPWSHREGGRVRLTRYAPQPERIKVMEFVAECKDGRVSVCAWNRVYAGNMIYAGRDETAKAGWQWKAEPADPWYMLDNPKHALGSFRWEFYGFEDPSGSSFSIWTASLPCWLLAAASGIWPVATLLPLLRRGMRAYRRWRIPPGCCIECGYDLRATPDAGGALLGRCPECGKETG